MFSSPFDFPWKSCNKNIKSVFEFSSRKSVAIYFTSRQCKSKAGVFGPLLSLASCLFTIFWKHSPALFGQDILHTMSRIARQTYTAEEDSQHIRRKNNPVIISYFSPEVLSVIAAPTLLSVIDDKEVASDTWTSSLFTPHLRANGSLPWWE